jgi:hypothetical protein
MTRIDKSKYKLSSMLYNLLRNGQKPDKQILQELKDKYYEEIESYLEEDNDN